MNGRLKLIEQQLLGIDSAAFQSLCDTYLKLREPALISINRTGSQLGKQKTVKGTPDTFLRSVNGNLYFVEITTQADALVKKIITDIDKCIDPKKIGIPKNKVCKLIFCFNSKLDVEEETEITEYAISNNIQIELIGIDWIALEIYSKYPLLAKDILGLPLDTGQLLPLHIFIEEYNNKSGKLSTPLNNIFLNRKIELSEIKDILLSCNLLVISGFPGVGKTKIAIESINSFLSMNKDYSALAVSKKDQDISDDLKMYLQQEQNYILLVDDANRQLPNFKQILNIFREKRKGNIKLVITVRDYALKDVINECIDYDFKQINLKKFNDKEITELINSDSFEIRNSIYQKKIIDVADGNARLAVMAARLAKLKQNDFLIGDVSDLYDTYFNTFIKDFNIFDNKTVFKTLGIISFFFTIDRSNKQFINSILNCFEIDYHDFNEAIDELEKRELLEVQYNHARVTEQVMSTYFFYVVFIKNEIIPFKSLLSSFFPLYKKRFSDTIIPSINSFGYSNVFSKVNNSLDEYLDSAYEDERKVLDFFSIFWFYKMEALLAYFHKKIVSLPEPENPSYNSDYKLNDFVSLKNEALIYVTELFSHYSDSFLPSIELAFEYCRKNPDSLPELIRLIREKLVFDEEESEFGFQRQVMFYNLLITKYKEGHIHYVEAFYAITKTFLLHNFQYSRNGRNNSIMLYHYTLPFNNAIKNLRKLIWSTLFESFELYPDKVLSVIKNYIYDQYKIVPEILEYDLSFILPNIENKLNANSFEHIHFIQSFTSWLDKEKITDRSYQILKNKFNSEEYKYYRKLDWNRHRNKEDYEYKNYEDFERLKELDIRNSFIVKTQEDINFIVNVIIHSLSISENNYGINKSIDIIVEENFIQNNALGFQLLAEIIKNDPIGINSVYNAIKTISGKSHDYAMQLWDLIKMMHRDNKLYWQLTFFENLPSNFVDVYFNNELVATIDSINQQCSVPFESLEKYHVVDKDVIAKLLNIVVNKIESKSLNIGLGYKFFERYITQLSANYDLLVKAYIQQKKLHNHFDFDNVGFNSLVKINSQFLLDYVTQFHTDIDNDNRCDSYDNLNFVWDIDNYEILLEASVNKIIDNTHFFGILEHGIIVFFRNLKTNQITKAKQFILMYIVKYNSETKRMNAIFDVIRHTLSDFFEEAFQHFIGLNSKEEDFKEIIWTGNNGIQPVDDIISDKGAKEWQKIYDIINKSKNQLNLIPIKAFIIKKIGEELERAEFYRKREFIEPDGF